MTIPALNDLLSDFEILDDWEDRYKYVIELGGKLPDFPDEHRTDDNKVQGCASQVWLVTNSGTNDNGSLTLNFIGDSDALIVRGLIAILLAIYSSKTPSEILDIDAKQLFNTLGLQEHLTSQRSNGLFSMVERIRKDAEASK